MLQKNHKATELQERMIDFSVMVISTYKPFLKSPEMHPLIIQLIRSATSIGANYHEANNASSKKDFQSKIYICKKEAAETQYWLELLSRLLPDLEADHLKNEAQQLIKIFQQIISTMNAKNEK